MGLMGKIWEITKILGKFQVLQLKRVCQMEHIYLLKKNDIVFDHDQYLYH